MTVVTVALVVVVLFLGVVQVSLWLRLDRVERRVESQEARQVGWRVAREEWERR